MHLYVLVNIHQKNTDETVAPTVFYLFPVEIPSRLVLASMFKLAVNSADVWELFGKYSHIKMP